MTPKTYQTVPELITAEQWNPDGREPLSKVPGVCTCYAFAPHIHSLHGDQIICLRPGDYVVVESDGIHYYAIAPDVFVKKYTEVQ